MKIRLSRKIDFNKFNKIQINNIFNKAMTNENVFDTYDVNKYNHPSTTLHCMLIESPVNVVTGIDINDSIIDQYLESYDEYRKNQVGRSGRVYTLNIDTLKKMMKLEGSSYDR